MMYTLFNSFLYTSSGASAVLPGAVVFSANVRSVSVFFFTSSGERHFPLATSALSRSVKFSSVASSSMYVGETFAAFGFSA